MQEDMEPEDLREEDWEALCDMRAQIAEEVQRRRELLAYMYIWLLDQDSNIIN